MHRQLAAVPLAHPDAPAAVAPHAPRALALGGWLDDGRGARLAVDARDERPRERAPPDVARRRHADAVGPAAARRVLHRDLAGGRHHLADHARLAGVPEVAVAIERRGVEVGVRRALGQTEHAHLAPRPADADDGVLATVGEPGRPVRALDHPVRRRSGAECDELRAAGLRVEPAEVAAALRAEPHAAIGGRRHVVDAGALRCAQGPRLHARHLLREGGPPVKPNRGNGECGQRGTARHRSRHSGPPVIGTNCTASLRSSAAVPSARFSTTHRSCTPCGAPSGSTRRPPTRSWSHERRRHVGRRSGDEDGVVGRAAWPAGVAVADVQRHVVRPERRQALAGGRRQRLDNLHAVHAARQPREHGGLVAAAGADLEHVVVRAERGELGHECDDERLGDGLPVADRQRPVVVGGVVELGRHEAVPRHDPHRVEHSVARPCDARGA